MGKPQAQTPPSYSVEDSWLSTPNFMASQASVHYRLLATSTPEDDDFVPSAGPEPSSITFSLYRLPQASTSTEGEDGFFPSAVPEPSSVPLHRSPVIVRSIRLPSAGGGDDPPSVAFEPSIPDSLYGPTSLEDSDFVPSAAPEPSSIRALLHRPLITSLEDDDLVPAAAPETSSITVPLYRPPEITPVGGDGFVPSSTSSQPLSIIDPQPESASDYPASADSEVSSTTLQVAQAISTAVRNKNVSAKDIVIV